MIHRSIRLLAAGFVTVAAALGTSFVSPAHADVSGNGITLPGNTFQVGQTYSFTVKTTTPTDPVTLMDAAGGVIIGNIGEFWPDATGTVSLTWTPEFGGTHQVYVVQNAQLLPANALFGPVTVQVTGTPTAPTVCEPNKACMTVTGTPQVGCPLTLDFVAYPSNIRAAAPGNSLLSGSAQQTGTPHWPDGTTQNEINFFDTAVTISPTIIFDKPVMISPTIRTDGAAARAQWTPTVSGFHRLEASITMPPNPDQAGHTLSAEAGMMFVPVAAAGTSPCAS
ncbi:hypothetical protein [Nocardia tengchongensis]|uniref:hypothetical protein n=1 Tax=Nocardia tengchongensis TaxID=2055889 RepID=UPI0036B31AD5